MSQPYCRVYNFSAGPCTLPIEVLEEAREDLMNYKGAGMSVMEMSHRSKTFENILAQTVADFRKVANIPDNYHVLFLQGGASTEFSLVPMNFLGKGQSADYIVTGVWGKKGYESALLEGNINLIYDGKPNNYSEAPDLASLKYDPKAAYIQITSNETVQGVQFKGEPNLPGTWFCDMSSDILSRPFDVTKYALVYAGAQKNMGPAGATLVLVRDDMLEKIPQGLSPMFDFRVQAENGSMYNTPPCWSIYMCGLMYKYLLSTGGLAAAEKRNEEKAKILYDAIDGSGGYYKGHAKVDSRSKMNVTFTLPSEEITNVFLKEAETHKLDGMKGHRATGGIRASIYNAFPKEGCEVLAGFMKDFAKRNG